MDKLERYRETLKRLLAEYARCKPRGQIETKLIIDPDNDHYEVMHVGWDGPRRVHGAILHVDIIDGKFWIQHEGTDRPIADELVAAGVPRADIVLGFQPPDVRKYTDFAVA